MSKMDKTEWVIWLSLVAYIIMTQQVNRAATQTTTLSSPPVINYTCDTQGTVNISTTTIKNGHYSRIGVHVLGVSGSNSTCHKPLTDVSQFGNEIQLKGCKLNDPIYVYIMKETLGRIIGGHAFHEYRIACNIPSDGVVLSANATIVKEATPPPRPETQTPSLAVTMSIKPTSPVTIGQELTVEIRLNNQLPVSIGKLYILPESCDASSGQVRSGTPPAHLNLLNSSMTADPEIMKNFNIFNNGSAITTVYAFRFIESPTIILQCKVHVCIDKSCNNTFQYYASKIPTNTTDPMKNTPAPARRKRQAEEQRHKHPQTHVVKAMFSVGENERKTSGQAPIGVCAIGLIGMLLVKPIVVLL